MTTYFWKETNGWFYGEPNGAKSGGPYASYDDMLKYMDLACESPTVTKKVPLLKRPSDPDGMSRSAIVKLYNKLAAQTGDKPVNDFKDKATAQRRLAAIQAKASQE
jgi:hypothetical protein